MRETQRYATDETGFFVSEAFSLLGQSELDRAKRRGFGLTLVAVQIDPLEQIKNDLGPSAASRLLSVVAQELRQSIRSYDHGFHFRENVFLLLFSETDPVTAKNLVARARARLFSQDNLPKVSLPKGFVVDNKQTEVIPRVRVGVSVFPHDALELTALVKQAFVGAQLMVPDVAGPTSELDAVAIDDYTTLVSGDGLLQEETDVWPVGFWSLDERALGTCYLGKCAIEPELGFEEEEEEITEKTRRLQDRDEDVLSAGEMDVIEEESEEHSVVAHETLESELAALVQEVSETETVQNEAPPDIPDVVLALTQEAAAADKTVQNQNRFDRVPAALDFDEISEITGITDIRVLQGEGDEDIIMVDFEREKFDLAEKFRRHQKQRRVRGIRS